MGEHVLTVEPTGSFGYSKVVINGRHGPEGLKMRVGAEFTVLTYRRGGEEHTFEATADHYIATFDKPGAAWSKARMLMARDVKPGHWLLVIPPDQLIHAVNATKLWGEVVATQKRFYTEPKEVGNPVTARGNVVVDGVVASSYPLWLFRSLVNTRLKPYLYPINFLMAHQLVTVLTWLSDDCLRHLDELLATSGFDEPHSYMAYVKVWAYLGRMILWGCGRTQPQTASASPFEPSTDESSTIITEEL